MELNRQDSSRKALLSHHAGGGNTPAMAAERKNSKGKKQKDGNGAQNRKATPRAKSKGRGKGEEAPSGVCFSFWRTGACSTQGCKWEHRANPNKGKGGKGGRRNPSTDSKGPPEGPRLHQRALQVPRSRELQARGPVPIPP